MRASDSLARWLLACVLLCCASLASAQGLPQVVPVSTTVSGNTATVVVGPATAPLADLTLTFDDATNLSASSLGVSAQVVNLNDAGLLARLPGLLTQPDAAFPVMVTIEPPSTGGLAFNRTVRVEVHTHALTYSAGTSYRLFKASLGAGFKDITDDVAPGSVRARGTTGGFSQFLILADVRETSTVVAQKIAALRARIDTLPSAEQAAFDAYVDAAETAVANAQWSDAIAAVDSLRARAASRAGNQLTQQWLATRNGDNQAGDLMAGAATLRFSIGYLRDYGN